MRIYVRQTQIHDGLDTRYGRSGGKARRYLKSPPDYYGANRATLESIREVKFFYTRRSQVREEKIYLPLVKQPL
jgi:hypothetical protein